VGVADTQTGDTLESLTERADAALYAAKRAGRNRVSVATAGPSS
jgi:PleD family two-component response regulator